MRRLLLGSNRSDASPLQPRTTFLINDVLAPDGGFGGSRGVDAERRAKGGSNPALVRVAIAAEDVVRFKEAVNLKRGTPL
jgi:hypothetical protein